MMPRWASASGSRRQRYETQEAASLDVSTAIPQAGHPDRHDRAGLVLLDGEPVGLARSFDPARFPDPDKMGRRHPRLARARDDLGVAASTIPAPKNFKEMRGERLPLPANLVEGQQRLGRRRGYPNTYYDAFNPEARRAILVADERRALQQARRRLVDGRHRAGLGRSDADARGRSGRT